MSEVNKCVVCDSDKVTEHPKVKDSFYGLQYLCDDDEKGCWDTYEGWYCDTCLLLHDHETTMESDNSCQKEGWVSTPDLDISFQHCGRPAYWEGDEVYCSKCQTKLED